MSLTNDIAVAISALIPDHLFPHLLRWADFRGKGYAVKNTGGHQYRLDDLLRATSDSAGRACLATIVNDGWHLVVYIEGKEIGFLPSHYRLVKDGRITVPAYIFRSHLVTRSGRRDILYLHRVRVWI